MKKILGGVLISALAITGGASPAFAADPATLTISGGKDAVLTLGPVTLTATASVAGKVEFKAAGVTIKGCEAVATATATPFTAKCSWQATKSVLTALSGVLTPTDTTIAAVTAPDVKVTPGVNVQGDVVSPINIFVDTVLASGTTGVLAGRFGVSCAVTSQYILGQTIVFRVYANNADWGGASMDSTNTAKAYIEVAGVKDPLPLTYGNHSGTAFWTAVLKTGAAPLYNTLGVINYKITMVAKDTSTAKVLATKRVAVKDATTGKTTYKYVSYYRTSKLRNPLAGAVGTLTPTWAAATSMLTLYAVPNS